MMRRFLAAASALLVTFFSLNVTTASAATLDVTAAPAAFVMQDSACAPGTNDGAPVIGAAAAGLGTANTYSQVSLTGIPTDCQNLPLDVMVHDAQGALIAASSAPVSAPSAATTVSVGDYVGAEVTQVVVRIAGWLFPTTWQPPAPSNPTPPLGPVTCYQLDANGDLVMDASGMGVPCESEPVLWNVNAWPGTLQVEYQIDTALSALLVFDFSHPTYAAYDGDPAASSVQLFGYNGGNHLREGYDCSALPVLEIVAVHPRPHEGVNRVTGAVYLHRTPQWNSVCSN